MLEGLYRINTERRKEKGPASASSKTDKWSAAAMFYISQAILRSVAVGSLATCKPNVCAGK